MGAGGWPEGGAALHGEGAQGGRSGAVGGNAVLGRYRVGYDSRGGQAGSSWMAGPSQGWGRGPSPCSFIPLPNPRFAPPCSRATPALFQHDDIPFANQLLLSWSSGGRGGLRVAIKASGGRELAPTRAPCVPSSVPQHPV